MEGDGEPRSGQAKATSTLKTAKLHLLMSFTQQNYLAKMALDGSIFLCENPVFMSVRVVVIPLGITTTWMDPDRHKDGIFMETYGAIQVCLAK